MYGCRNGISNIPQMRTKITFLNAPQRIFPCPTMLKAVYGAVASCSGYQVPQTCRQSLDARCLQDQLGCLHVVGHPVFLPMDQLQAHRLVFLAFPCRVFSAPFKSQLTVY